MHRILSVAALAALAGGACDSRPAREAPSSSVRTEAERTAYVFTTDEGANALSRINVTTGEVRHYPLAIRPHNVQASADGTRVVVAGPVATGPGEHGEHQGGTAPGRLLVIDAESMDVAKALAVDIGSQPAHVVVSADTRRAFVTDSAGHQVQIVDLDLRRVIKAVPTGRYPHGLRVSPNGREIAVANLQDDSVSVIDTAAAREIARVSVGDAPVQVAWSPDGQRLFASLRDEDAVAAVDVASRRKVASIGVGDGPIQLFTTPDGAFLYVANEGASGAPGTTVSVIDTAGSRVVKTITVGNGPHGVVISTDGRRVYVTNRFDDTVSEIDVATQTVQRTFRVGDEPTGVTYAAGTTAP